MNDFDIGYVIGLLEGEGCFTSNGSKRTNPRIICTMTDKEPLEKLKSILEGTITGPRCVKNNKPIWSWRLNKYKSIVNTCETIFSYMSPRRQAAITKMFLAHKPSNYGNPQHGTYNMYCNYGCRCASCKIAHNLYCQTRRSKNNIAEIF